MSATADEVVDDSILLRKDSDVALHNTTRSRVKC